MQRLIAQLICFLFLSSFSIPLAAAPKESPANRYADDAELVKGSTIAILVSKSEYNFRANTELPGAKLIKSRSWVEHALMAKGSTQILKELDKHLRQLGFSTKIVNTPENIPPNSYVINANLVFRPAILSGKVAKWDGVKAKHKARGFSAANSRFSGSTRGISLRLSAYDSNGRWLFNAFGGVALPFYSDLKDVENKLKEDVYADKRNMVDGVRAAVLAVKKISVVKARASNKGVAGSGFSEAFEHELRMKSAKCDYKRYLDEGGHKAFFVGADNAVGWSWDHESVDDAVASARDTCEIHSSGGKCSLFDIDGELQVNTPMPDLPADCRVN